MVVNWSAPAEPDWVKIVMSPKWSGPPSAGTLDLTSDTFARSVADWRFETNPSSRITRKLVTANSADRHTRKL